MGNPASGTAVQRTVSASQFFTGPDLLHTDVWLSNERGRIPSAWVAQLGEAGCREVHHPEEADILIVNTCRHTAEGRREGLQRPGEIPPAQEEEPEAIVVVAGCVAQQAGEALWNGCRTSTSWLVHIMCGGSTAL